jgi:DNA-binding NtrC family response regulator
MTDKIKLLIVDGQIEHLYSTAKLLELLGFDVTTAVNGLDAIDHASQGGFDLAIVDLKVPGVDGRHILSLIKSTDELTEVIAMTGRGSIEAVAECRELGAFGCLPKLCKTASLLKLLQSAYASRLRNRYQSDPILMKRLTDQENNPDSVGALNEMRALSSACILG